MSNAYNGRGDLVSARVSGGEQLVRHRYEYDEAGRLINSELQRGTTMDFVYDANGAPYAVVYNGTTYYYVLNQQGDVVRIVTSGGTSYGTYRYDAWGKILYQTDNALMNANPLRYRGYVYDSETQLYYLNSRYYDPALGRFINADALMSTGQGILGNNMFAYCGNNPVNYIDPSGEIAVIDDLLVLSSVIVIVLPVITLIVAPPPPVLNELIEDINQFVGEITEAFEHTADILTAKTKGKERIRDTGLSHESDEEVRRKAHDKSLPKSEQRRYQTEEKARGIRNRRKRIELYQ